VATLGDRNATYALQGHVKHQGLPVSNVLVRVYAPYSSGSLGLGKGDPHIDEVYTGSKGEFSFALPPGSYAVEVIPGNRTRFLKEKVSQVELYASATCNVGLTTGTILTGSVITSDGDKLMDSEVVALGIEPTPYATTSTIASDGTYTLVLPRGKFHVASRHLHDDAHQQSEANESTNGSKHYPYISTQVHVVNQVVDGSLDLQLPELLKYRGEVQDVFGQPVANATVKFHPTVNADQIVVRELNLFAECKTDSQGNFEVWLEPGIYELEINPAPAATHFGLRENNVRVKENITRKFVLEEGHKLRGEVLFEDTPQPGCLVRVQEVSGTKEFIAKTDSAGQFVLGVPGGSYKMIVIAHPKNAPTVTIDGAEHTGIAPWAKIIVIGGDTQVSVELRSGTALRGRIRDDSGQARANMQISVFADNNEKLNAETADWKLALAHTITDADGRYSIFLAPGAYLIVVHKDFENATEINVEEEPVNLDITWHGWCQIKFEIVSEDGAAVPRCKMEYHPYGEREDDLAESANLPRGYVLTDEDGRCQVTIPQGVYTFKFNPPSSGSYDSKDIRQLSISSDISRKVVLGLKRNG